MDTPRTPTKDVKRITAMQLRRQSGQVLNNVYYKGQTFLVSRAGKPMAIVMPFPLAQDASVTFSSELREAFGELSEVELENLVDEAVRAVRTQSKVTST